MKPQISPIALSLGRGLFLSQAGLALVVFLVALAPRLWGFDWNLPYVFNQDPLRYYAWAAVNADGTSSRPVADFRNPSLFRYLLSAEYRLLDLTLGPADQSPEAQHERAALRLATQRLTVALMSAAAVSALALATATLTSPRIGLFAGLIMAFDLLGLWTSHIAANDAPALMFLCLGLFFSARYVRGERDRDLLLGGLMAGLATAAKYNFGVVGLVPATYVVLATARGSLGWLRALRALALLLLSAEVGLVIGMPEIVTDPRWVLRGVERQADIGQEPWPGQSEVPLAVHYLLTLVQSAGPPAALLALVGLARSLRRASGVGLALTACPLVYLAVMLSQELMFVRFALPLTPFLALYAALGLDSLTRFGIQAFRWTAQPDQRLPTARLATPLLALVLVVPIANAIQLDQIITRDDTRVQAVRWVRENLRPGTRILASATSLPIAEPGPGDGLDGYDVRAPRLYSFNPPRLISSIVCDERRRIVMHSSFESDFRRERSQPGAPPTGLELVEREGELLARFSHSVSGEPLRLDPDDRTMPFWRMAEIVRPGPTIHIYRMPSRGAFACA